MAYATHYDLGLSLKLPFIYEIHVKELCDVRHSWAYDTTKFWLYFSSHNRATK